jgi:hypothetical protein
MSVFHKIYFTLVSLTLGYSIAFSANNYYVSPKGSDSDPGSLQKPFKTFLKASKQTQPGDTVFIRGSQGEFIDIQFIEAKGNVDKWIVFTNYKNEKPVVNAGKDPAKDCSTSPWPIPNIITIRKSEYVILDGVEAKNYCGRAMQIQWGDHITVRNCLLHNVFEGGVNMNGEYITFENNEIHHACMKNRNGKIEAGWAWPASSSTHPSGQNRDSKHIIYRNNWIHDTWGEGFIALRADDALIEGNTFANTWSIMCYMDYSINVTIRNNLFFADDTAFSRKQVLTFPATAVAWATEGGPTYPDYKTDRAIENVKIYNNIMVGTGRGTMFYYYGSNSIKNQTYKNILIAHNLIYDIKGDRPIEASEIKKSPAPQNVMVVNNIISKGTRGVERHRDYKVGPFDGEGDDETGWTFTHNLWVDGIPEKGTHSQSIEGDPMITIPQNLRDINGYSLENKSPCFGAGKLLKEVPVDMFGNKRQGNPTLGPIEENTQFPVSGKLPPVMRQYLDRLQAPETKAIITGLSSKALSSRLVKLNGRIVPFNFDKTGNRPNVSRGMYIHVPERNTNEIFNTKQ